VGGSAVMSARARATGNATNATATATMPSRMGRAHDSALSPAFTPKPPHIARRADCNRATRRASSAPSEGSRPGDAHPLGLLDTSDPGNVERDA
jgi:hypothetical protein